MKYDNSCIRKIIFILALALILNLNIVSSSFVLGNKSYSVDVTYGTSKPIKGWINISLKNEPENSMLTYEDKNISILDFLNLNEADYSCSPIDCDKSYSSIGSEVSFKNFSIDERQSKLIGIKLTGNIDEINSLSFNISSNSGKSCLNPIRLDVLDDGLDEWKANEITTSEFCYIEKKFGCYNSANLAGNSPFVMGSAYCETIRVPPVKGFKVGAIVNGSGKVEFKITVTAESEKECRVFANSSGEISCNVEFDDNLEKYTDAEVCIQPVDLAGKSYGINYEDVQPCGYFGDSSNKHDFEIFAMPYKFNSVNRVSFDERLLGEDNNLGSQITDYIETKYEKNCTLGCIIPIRIYSGINQDINIFNLNLGYKSGLPKVQNKFYEIKETPVLISSDFQKLDLELANFILPSLVGDNSISIYLDGENVLSENIKIRKIAEIMDILPHTAPALVPSKFIAMVDGVSVNATNVSYKWNFGDNSVEETTNTGSIKHIYTTTGDYELELKVSNNFGVSSKTINVKVTSPKDYISQTISDYRDSIKNVSTELNKLPQWIRNEIDGTDKKLDLEGLNLEINSIEEKYKDAFTDEEYTEIMTSLLNLKIPSQLSISQTIKPMKFLQNKNQMDFSLLKAFDIEAPELNDDEKEKYYNALNNWFRENLDVLIESKTYTIGYRNGLKETLFSYVKLTLTPKDNLETYIVIKGDNKNIKFSEDVNAKDIEENAVGIKLSDFQTAKTIEFIYPDKIDPFNLPILISPELSLLETGVNVGVCNHNGVCESEENYNNCRDDCKPWTLAFIYLGILLFIAFIIYIILQEWYKRHYESSLFSNKSQLFNLINFMYNSSNQGLGKQETFSKLKNYGWTSEQMTYAWNKFKGYRTGMWEIPLFKWFENKKVKEEIEKRKGTNTNKGINPRK